ncbi:hypothetical protein DFH08DRAFT_958951 [Mycena albidolilacea]|uniref:F-box domain-containing protein n=1 Tax=Mycena albidolilacea TaxID=1033008 RepID=A0AAD7ETR5_9AGAR|nr:hypothetical protein DFH08DRAFT_958951 [Mycena albidolilacea]
MALEALGDDILLQVLLICDVYTALSVSLVNKPLRRIALAKQLWLSLLQDLGSVGALDLPEKTGLERCSTTELVNHVRRGIVGPAAWLPGSSPSHTAPCRQVTFDAGVDVEDLIDMHILRGGYSRYVLLRTRERLHVYEFAKGRRIWSCVTDYRTTTWSMDLPATTNVLRVLLLPVHHSGPHDITIRDVDLISGQSTEIFSLELVTGLERWMPRILGDFFVFALQPSNPVMMFFLLVNWRTEEYVVLNSAGRSYSTVGGFIA